MNENHLPTNECELLGLAGILVNVVLAIISFSALIGTSIQLSQENS